MKTQTTKTRLRSARPSLRWVSGLVAIVMLSVSFTPTASARILFQDDATADVVSEGIIIDSDNTGTDITLQLGNDGADGTITWTDATSILTIGDGTDNVAVNSASWDVSSAGVGSGFTGFTSTGSVDFNGASGFRIREVNAPNTNAACAVVNELVMDTATNQLMRCTGVGVAGVATWTNVDTTGGSSDFEAVYTNDADKVLTTSGGNFSTATGAGTLNLNTGAGDTGAITIGGNGGTVAINSSDWDISATGDITGAGAITADGLITGTAGATLSGAATSINASSNFATNINTGTSTGAVSIGGGSGTVAINSSSWDISTAGVASGFTGLTSTGVINFSGAGEFRMRENADPATNSACTTLDELIVDTTDNQVQICTATGVAGAATWVNVADGGNAGTLDGLDSLQFLRADVNDVYGSGAGAETLTIGDGTNADGIAFAANSTINFANATISNLDDASVDFSQGGYAATDVSAAFAELASSAAGDGGTLIGFDNTNTANLSATTVQGAIDETFTDLASNANGLGASLIGIEDAGGAITATTVEGALVEIAGNANKKFEVLHFYPEYPDTVVYQDGSNNKGKLETLYDAAGEENYYQWTSKNATTQDVDLRFRFTLPNDFASVGDLTYRFRTGSVTEADNDVEVTIANATDETTGSPTACGSDLTNGSTTWATGTIAAATITTGCTGATALNPGDVIEVQIKLLDNSGGADFANVGYIDLAYTK